MNSFLNLKHSNSNFKITFNISILALYSSLVFVSQIALFFIPNVELVTLLIAYSTVIFKFAFSLSISLIFCFLEGIYYGFGDWIITYFIIWPLLVIIVFSFKKLKLINHFSFILICTIFGFTFGTIDAVIKLTLYNKFVFYAYWIKGLIFDLVHGCSNFLIAYFLYKPLINIWNTNLKRYF